MIRTAFTLCVLFQAGKNELFRSLGWCWVYQLLGVGAIIVGRATGYGLGVVIVGGVWFVVIAFCFLPSVGGGRRARPTPPAMVANVETEVWATIARFVKTCHRFPTQAEVNGMV